MVPDPETLIVALATPPGRGALAIVRLSGAGALQVGARLARRDRFTPRVATLARLHLPEGLVEAAIVTAFVAPHSFTGQDALEISAHGSPVIVDAVLQACLDAGARLARPGEFTWRAYLNGRLDLLQAEAVADLVTATTRAQVRVASAHLDGTLSLAIRDMGDGIARLRTLLEASLDFPDEGFHFIEPADVVSRLEGLRAVCGRLLGSAEAGRRLLEGARVVVAGRPNAGKSSLFNALLGRQRAIVTSVAGTTRDILTETTSLGGVPVTLVDTAGLREGRDPIEREGVSRAEASLASADLVLLVVDSMAVAEELEESARLWGGLEGRARLCVINKLDLWTSPAWPAPAGPGVAPSAAAPPTPEACALPGASAVASAGATPADVVGASPRAVPAWWPTDAVWVSARDGEGLQALEARLCAILGQVTWEGDTLTRARHRSLVGLCAAALGRAAATAGGGGSEEYVLADLHEALTALEDLRGVESPDEVLESIFSTFCIGK